MNMSILDKITKTTPKAPRITIYGRPGIGKSTLAAAFPKPLFVLTEETGISGVDALPVARTFDEFRASIKELLAIEDLPYKTIVIDSISKLDALIVRSILDNEPLDKHGNKPSTLNAACGGYGAGNIRAQSVHRGFKGYMDKFQERGITVIYVSHLAVTKLKTPDSEDYDIHSIVMNHDKSREVYIDDVDGVFLCKLRSFVTKTESGRDIIKSTGDRIIITGMDDAHVSKNRFKMPKEIGMSFEEIKKYIDFYNEGE
jgi:hypothetical protein